MLSLLTLLDDQINTTEIGKTELYASCVNSIADILSQGLVIQCHNNDTLPDLANVLQNNPFHYLLQIGGLHLKKIDKHRKPN